MGGPPTISTVDDTTPPQAPARQPATEPSVEAGEPEPTEALAKPAETTPGRQLAAAPDHAAARHLAPASAPPTEPADRGAAYIPHGPVHIVMPSAGDSPERPTAEELVRPREEMQREQISVLVPKDLELRRRMRLMWAHEGMEVRDQAALALDGFLRSRGY